MMTHAYNQLYLEDAMHNMGTMLDCAVRVANCDLAVFYEMFLSSGVASQMESGNPRYIAGLSGMELMCVVLSRASDLAMPETTYAPSERTREYWVGWALAYYQWQTGYSFSFIQRNGLDISTILSLYPTLHEADITKFVTTADSIIERHLANQHSALKVIRKQMRMTQKKLSDLSGVSLRMIQAYEQEDQDIRKAEAQSVLSLSRVLGCAPEILCHS